MNVTPKSSTVKKEGLWARLTKGMKKFAAKRERTARDAVRAGYPGTGTGLRQGARLARQKAAGLLDFSASGRCIAAIENRKFANTVQVGA